MNQLTPQHLVTEMIEHAHLDNFIQSTWIDNDTGKGCMWGCTMQSDNNAIERACQLYNIPLWLGYLSEAIFEGLSVEDAKKWPVDCIEAFCEYEGDAENIKHEIAILRLTTLAENNPSVANEINGIIVCHQQYLNGDLDIDWQAAELAAELAALADLSAAELAALAAAAAAANLAAAESAYSARSAALSAAESAALAAASDSADLSALSARSAALSAAELAALAANSAARSALAAALAAARSSWKLEAGNLLKVLRNKGVVNGSKDKHSEITRT